MQRQGQSSYKRVSTSPDKESTKTSKDSKSNNNNNAAASPLQAKTNNNDDIVMSRLSNDSLLSEGSSRPISPSASSTTQSNANAAANNNSNSSNKTTMERLSEKFYALLWVILATSVAYYLDLPYVLLSDQRVHRNLFNISAFLVSVNLVLVMYLGVYLPKFVGLKDSSAWEVYCPRVIPIMTACGLIAFFMGIRALWPIWGFLTPVVVGVECFGCLFAMHFIPWI